MPSVKQVEAFYWSATLGSFVAAAEKLNTCQSNISKRIQEIEQALSIQAFDRTKRTIRLTAKGEELLRASENFLRSHNVLKNVSRLPTANGPFRFGVNEAIGMTWLGKLCAAISESFPGLTPIAKVAVSDQLNVMLRDHTVDLVIGARVPTETDLEPLYLSSIDYVWVASPLLGLGDTIELEDLAHVPILGHGEGATRDAVITKALRDRGIAPNFVTHCNYLTSLARMAVAGLGITYLHRGVFDEEIRRGLLKEIKVGIDLPMSSYVAVHRHDPGSTLAGMIALKAREVCSFNLEGLNGSIQ